MAQYQSGRLQRGFTIVELLIVVIVIAILATITIVSFNGIQQRARTSAVQNEVSQLVRQIEAAKISSGTEQYPDNQSAANLRVNSGLTVNYYKTASNTYCVEAQTNGIIYSSRGAGTQMVNSGCLQDGLIAAWNFNNNTLDSSGNNYNGTSTDITPTTGQNGASNSALLFNGTSSLVTSSTANNLAPSTLTISAWVRPTNWSSPTASAIVTKRTGSNGIFFFYLNATQSITLDHGISSRWNTGYAPPLNQWTHLAITSVTGERIFYVNGNEFARSDIAVGPTVSTTAPLAIGADPSGSATNYFFAGSIDDVRMFNRPLSASEVSSIYSQGAR